MIWRWFCAVFLVAGLRDKLPGISVGWAKAALSEEVYHHVVLDRKWRCSFSRQNDITVRHPRGIYLGPAAVLGFLTSGGLAKLWTRPRTAVGTKQLKAER